MPSFSVLPGGEGFFVATLQEFRTRLPDRRHARLPLRRYNPSLHALVSRC